MMKSSFFFPRLLLVVFSAVIFSAQGDARAQEADDGCAAGTISRPIFILRQDFNDVPSLTCVTGQSTQNSVGTRLSFTGDFVAKNDSFSIDGLGAADFLYNTYNTDLARILDGIAFGPYVQGVGIEQIANATGPAVSSDTLTGGGFAEFDIRPEPFQGRLRIHGGELTSNLGIRDPNFVIEYIPVFKFQKIEIGGGKNSGSGFDYSLMPELEFQDDRLAAGPRTFKLFTANIYAERLGPYVTIKLYNLDSFPKLVFSLTEHFSVDITSGRIYNIVSPILIYNLTDNVALSAGYAYGNSETTGNLGSQLKLALAAKL